MFTKIRHTLGHYLTQPVLPILAKARLTPNSLTIMGFILNLGVAWLLATGHLLIGGFLVLFSGGFDLLDGALARATGQATRFGALLDSTLDRLGEAVVLLGLLVLYTGQQANQEIILIYVVLAGSVLVSYVKARAEGLGMECQVGLFTRAERVIVLALGLIFNQVVIALWILAIFTNVTVAQRLFYVWRRREEKPNPPSKGESKE